jgi:RHS repeat-associated protein
MGYDAWGARRDPAGSPAPASSFNQQPGRREFTGHETIPSVGLINMNGRVYDPDLGRFLSPDPNIQFVHNLQSYNRYSYVLNNPLSFTDPTGYFLSEVWSAFNSEFAGQLLSLATIATCATGNPACAVLTIASTLRTTVTMAQAGASFGQIVTVTAIGMAAGQVGGALGSGVTEELGSTALAKVIGGGVAGYVSATLTAATSGGDGRGLGKNLLMAAGQGALSAAIEVTAQRTAPVSQAAAHEALARRGHNAKAEGFLGEHVTEAGLRKGLGLIGRAHMIDDLRNAGWIIELFEPGQIVQSSGDALRVAEDSAVAWTIGDENRILLSRLRTVEDAVLDLVHEYTHFMGGDERAAYAADAAASVQLKRSGGVVADTSQFVRNGAVDVAAIDRYMTNQERAVGGLYERGWDTVGIFPRAGSVTRLFY